MNEKTDLVDTVRSIVGGVLDLLVKGLVDAVNSVLLLLGDEPHEVLGRDLEGIRVARLDCIDGLVGDAVNADNERRKPDLQRLAELVSRRGETRSSRVRGASQEIVGQSVVQHIQRRVNHWNRGYTRENGDLWCSMLGGLCFCGRHGVG